MSSSSIEVMSEDVQMVMLQQPEVESQYHSISVLSQPEAESHYPSISAIKSNPTNIEESEQQAETTLQDGAEMEFETMEPFEGSNTILFSPQDTFITRAAQIPTGRKRGRPPKKPDALTIQASQDVDYNTIEFPVACEICNEVVANGKALLSHMTIHSDIKPFQCSYCPKAFTKLVHLQAHLVQHGIQKQYECPVCHQRFSRQDCVRVHMRLHDKSKCVYCNVCQKAFLTHGALNIHMRIHRGEKPFRCHLCGKCFTQKNHVLMHIRRHTKLLDDSYSKKLGPRMFQCEHCPRAFIRLSDYERHVQWNHGAVSENNSQARVQGADIPIEEDVKPLFLASNYNLHNINKPIIQKVMCTTATQTDESSGHVIIPRKYQTAITTTSTASTQVSAPPTPRADEELYETDIFDEGMDRNYSSDEDDTIDKSSYVNTTTYSASTSAKDDVFDAVIGKANPTSVKKDNIPKAPITPSISERMIPSACLERVSTKELDINKKSVQSKSMEIPQIATTLASGLSATDNSDLLLDTDRSIVSSVIKPPMKGRGQTRPPVKISQSFNMSNWQKVTKTKGRGRGKLKTKALLGLTGAAHLRLIRKSLMTFISDQNESDVRPKEDHFADAETTSSDRSGKRQTKAKQHGKDFICSQKTCTICPQSGSKNVSKEIKSNVQPKVKQEKEKTIGASKEKSKKLLQFLLSGDVTALEGTDFKLLSESDGEFTLNKLNRIDDIGFGQVYNEDAASSMDYEGQSYFKQHQSENDIVSPPVQLQSFCIPTYSCKICGREFRFEGKLHRHIESVHQKKAIFSSDVKPGKTTAKPTPDTRILFERKPKKLAPVNPEIAALRSEWDDDGDDDAEEQQQEEEEMEVGDIEERMIIRGPVHRTFNNVQSTYLLSTHDNIVNTKQITPVTTTMSAYFSQGVKVNLNKISGLAPGSELYSHSGRYDFTDNINISEKPVVKVQNSPLEVKCRKLLEKLFRMTLLLKCGLHDAHVSVVLGKVLQHYGVKMIEDYGQGQYEVLKYNLWRLIEWKVTMEQMEEFYTEGKSVEEMMYDIMNGRVPIIAHIEPGAAKPVESTSRSQNVGLPGKPNQIESVDAVQLSDNQLVLSQVATVLGGHINLADGVTQVMLAQDVSPEMLQGAHIVTLDPNTGQVISQVTTEQVILAGNVSEDISQQIQSIDSQLVIAHPSVCNATVVSTLPPGSIVASDGSIQLATIEGEVIESDPNLIKLHNRRHPSRLN